jgi:hypothetical protein
VCHVQLNILPPSASSLGNRNISVSPEKWFLVESESLCEIVWPAYWNVLDLVKMRMKWTKITWNTYFDVSRLQCIELQNISIVSCVWNRHKWFKIESETFLLTKRVQMLASVSLLTVTFTVGLIQNISANIIYFYYKLFYHYILFRCDLFLALMIASPFKSLTNNISRNKLFQI